jgi:hypothetical protein
MRYTARRDSGQNGRTSQATEAQGWPARADMDELPGLETVRDQLADVVAITRAEQAR